MKKKNNFRFLIGIAVIFVLPLSLFFIAKAYINDALKKGSMSIPPVYNTDSIITKQVDGKAIKDTFYHKVADVSLIDQFGHTRSLYSSGSKIWIIGFYDDLNAPSPLKFIEEGIWKKGRTFMQVMSINVSDKVPTLPYIRTYSDKFVKDPDFWWFLYGDPSLINGYINKELGVSNFLNAHSSPKMNLTDVIVLVDTLKHVRGYFNAKDSLSMLDCVNKAFVLSIEKHPKK